MIELKRVLVTEYELGADAKITLHQGGFLSTNYVIEDAGKKFFLKGYRFDEREKIAEIHKIKSYFSSKGIPVVLPLKTKAGDTFISIGGKYYAVFPFTTGKHHKRGSMPHVVIERLAHLLADMHRAGAACDFEVRSGFKDKGAQAFFETAERIEAQIKGKSSKDPFDELALKHLRLKIRLVRNDGTSADSFFTEKSILLHGDFQETNVFFDEGDGIIGIFDFEQAVIGPRAYELWRSADLMLLNGSFTEKAIQEVIHYFKTYNLYNPIKESDLAAGLEIYYRKLIRSLWIEQEHYLKGSKRVDIFLRYRHECISYLSENKKDFLKKIVSGVYGK